MSALITRRAPFAPATFDGERMTVDAVITTFADVPRREGKAAFIERLDPAGLDTSTIIGVPVLNAHRQGDARDVVGVIEAVRHEPGALVAVIRLSGAADAAPVIQRIREGTLTGVSIGYRVAKWEEAVENGRRIRTALAWSIHEVSAVPVPADPQSRFRSVPMEDDIDTIEGIPEADRARIRSIGEIADLQPSWAEGQIAEGASIEQARSAARTELVKRSQATPRIRVVSPAADDPAVTLERRIEGLAVRTMGGTPSEAARSYVSLRLIEHAREAVERTGVSTRGLNDDEIFRRAQHTTSDFPRLLTGLGNRALLPAYEAAQSPLKQLARQATAPDFRALTRLKLSGTGTLEKVSESGEIKHVTRGEVGESYAIDTYGSIFALSRKALINDDLGAFRDWGMAAGRAAAQTEGDLLFKLLTQNGGAGPVMGEDGKRLFHADHKNLLASSAIDLSAARLALRTQKGLDGKTPIAVSPKYIVVGPQLETAAEKELASIYATTTDSVNPFAGRLVPLVEPRIGDSSWYLFADPASLPVLEYAYLASAPGPQLSSREGFDVLGTEFRVTLDFGAGAIDWRGAVRNPGV